MEQEGFGVQPSVHKLNTFVFSKVIRPLTVPDAPQLGQGLPSQFLYQLWGGAVLWVHKGGRGSLGFLQSFNLSSFEPHLHLHLQLPGVTNPT